MHPGKSRTLPPRTSTYEYACKSCPCPGIVARIFCPVDKRTFAIFLLELFGFLGLMVVTFITIPAF